MSKRAVVLGGVSKNLYRRIFQNDIGFTVFVFYAGLGVRTMCSNDLDEALQ